VLEKLAFVTRRMEETDIEQVFAIDQRSFSLPWSERSYRFEVTDNPNSRPWVAETTHPDGRKEIVGMAVVWMIVDEAHIGTIAVHPDFRGLGIGRELMLAALRQAAQDGCVKACLEVRSGNVVAQNLYRSLGFEVVGVRPRYYKDNQEDAFLMDLEGLNQNNWSV
jgi:ribosomal-protein-alanine N-acetyltransferase